VQLSLPPTLYLGGLPRKYVAAQLHLHWGQKGTPVGSEHQINSEATAAEVPENKELGHRNNTGMVGPGKRIWTLQKAIQKDENKLWGGGAALGHAWSCGGC
jgi:hypothetical protein